MSASRDRPVFGNYEAGILVYPDQLAAPEIARGQAFA
jgi:hypothetical protein